MKKLLIALVAVSVTTGVYAQNLSCVNNGKKVGISINESKRTLKIVDDAKKSIVFSIYEINSYEVEEGTVTSYSIKDGRDAIGSSISGEVAILNGKKAAINLLNDSLGKTVLTIDSMNCK